MSIRNGFKALILGLVLTGSFVGGVSAKENLPSEGTYIPQPIKTNTTSVSPLTDYDTPSWSFWVAWNGNDAIANSDAYLQRSDGSVVRDPIRRIYAKTRIYSTYNGTLLDSKTDDEAWASHAGSKASSSGWYKEAYGTHIFVKDGYMQHTFETYKKY